MLFKRYANPLALLKTYTLGGAVDFVLYLIEIDREEKLEYMWIHDSAGLSRGLSYDKWKKQNVKSEENKKPKRTKIDKEKEEESLKLAEQILGKPMQKGGGEMNV